MSLGNRKISIIIDVTMLVLVACFIMRIFAIPAKHHYDVDRNVFPVKGVDVSAHNGYIDFDALKQDTVTFVYMKATEGTDFCDANFSYNYNAAQAAGLKTGAYHFFRFDSPGEIQAGHFLASVEGRIFDLPLAIDVEKWGNSQDYEIKEVKEELRNMVDMIRAYGYPVIIYTNRKGHNTFIGDDFPDTDLWICSLSGLPGCDWRLWQHSHRSKVQGSKKPMDIDTYSGDHNEFMEWLVPFMVNNNKKSSKYRSNITQ